MKRLLVTLLIVCPALPFAQNRFPDYRSVLMKFFSLYHHDSSPQEILNFARKKDGWHVQILNSTKQDTVVSDQLFWSAQKGRYQVLENFVGANAEPLDKKVEEQVGNSYYFPYGYERCVYYGYDGWDADVIKDFEHATSLNDTLLESLARACSYYYTRYTWYQYGGRALPGDTLQTKLERLQLPGDERVKKITDYAGKAVASYEKIYQHNKAYQTFGGNIESKLFDETFHAYLQLMMCNRPVEAEKFLAKCRLPASDSLSAQSVFSSLQPDAILFTFGDNDTYPLYYLQEKRNIRRDVTIMHTSLLGLPVYIEMLKRKNNLRMQSTAAEYGRNDFDYSFFSGHATGKKVLLTEFVATHANLRKVPTMGSDSVRVYNEKDLYMPFSKSPAAGIPAGQEDSLGIQLRDFVYANEFIMMDIIASNLQSRPIYFTSPWSMINEKNMLKKGIVFQLAPASK